MNTNNYLQTLKQQGFKGDVCQDMASRAVMSTDNSVYQLMPQAVLYPKDDKDVKLIFKLASSKVYKTLKFAARGGGTGTNGQSLTSGLVINFTKYMNKILNLDLDNKTVTVQPGVVREQLNDYLKPHGYFFAPHLSTGSRATLGGMVNTNACGKGSCIYGRTADHIVSLKTVMASGNDLNTKIVENHKQLVTQLQNLLEQNQRLIKKDFPKLLRYMTGYDLIHGYQNGEVNLDYLIAGSEGTLVNITECTLKLTKIPEYKVLFVLRHASFEEALIASEWLNTTNPAAIEVIDETVMQYSQSAKNFNKLKTVILDEQINLPGAINLVEYIADSKEDLINKIQDISAYLAKHLSINTQGFYIEDNEHLMAELWQLRKRSVESIGKMPEARKPVSGIEDTVVDPSQLKDYMIALKKLLDAHGLKYAMYGHMDAGCIHVRPALDLTNSEDEALYHKLSDEVADLVKTYGGLIWGEHGKGFRSQYIEKFIGKELCQVFKEVKTIFDPDNRLNPGKISTATISHEALLPITSAKKVDGFKNISKDDKKLYQSSMLCNGNAACFNYDPNTNICPSYKVTRDPIHSPKGRASIINEWLVEQKNTELEPDVLSALEGCLGCKACQTECPVSVNIPSVKSKFFEHYFTQHARSIKQHLILNGESISLFLSKIPKLSNMITQSSLANWVLKHFGIYDVPKFSVNKNKFKDLENPDLYLLIDWAYQCYEPEIAVQCYQLLTNLGYKVAVIDNFKHGKLLYNLGARDKFKQIASKNNTMLRAINQQGIPIVGIDPSLTMIFRDEYKEILPGEQLCEVQLLQEFLIQQQKTKQLSENKTYFLFSHCYESAVLDDAQQLWKIIFTKHGLDLQIVKVGCCGMAGSYGHETQHFENSKKLFEMSWQKAMEKHHVTPENMFVTGFSCREQVKRFCGFTPKHPVSILCGWAEQKASGILGDNN